MSRWKGTRAAAAGLAVALGGAFGGALTVAAPAVAAPPPVAKAPDAGAATSKTKSKWRFDAAKTTMTDVGAITGADSAWRAGVDGSGVGVALIDTGVVPVEGLRAGQVVTGPDLSFDSQVTGLRDLDTFGHGTHLAGIIAGTPGTDGFRGMAPGSRLTSVKVGAGNGLVDAAQVIAALDWVVEHRNDDPANPIRVITLAYGTDSTQPYTIDPIAHAAENAWRAGIVVVVAAGNDGTAPLTNPATDPYVLSVGAADSAGTVRAGDDTVLEFSSRGTAERRVDLVAPGRSIVSLRNPGGYIDETNPQARVGDAYMKGSGTSQAAAVVAGSVALLLQQRPDLTPDQVKSLLTATATGLPKADAAGRGAGELDLAKALRSPKVGATQTWAPSRGTGSLEEARGSAHIAFGDSDLVGENTPWGPFDSAAWAAASSAGTAWDGGRWMGTELARATVGGSGAWSGLTWSGRTWSGLTWSGLTWSGLTWSGLTWSGLTWSGLTWSGRTWSGLTWSGLTWSGLTWSSRTWSSRTWSSRTWSSRTWSSRTWSSRTWS
jgi:serine protease AprX